MRPFDQLVFSGGGVRCFWYGGFLEVVREPLELAPKRVSGVSGGALSAVCFIAGRDRSLLEHMSEAFREVEDNIDLEGDEPGDRLTPHQHVYRQVVEKTITSETQQAVADGPQFQVLVCRPPTGKLLRFYSPLLMVAYAADLKVRSTPQLQFTKWLGASEKLIDARQAACEGKLADLVCTAAGIPPIFEIDGWSDQKVIDGGFVCKAPLPEPDEGRTLVLLTRRFRRLPSHPDRVYAQVSCETPAEKLDFADAAALEETWELGREDGERFLNDHL